MKKIIKKISRALQIVLMAPIKLPGKALNIIKYIALGIGVVETVLDDKVKKGEEEGPPTAEGFLSNQEKEESDETK
ncbi:MULTISPECIES: hypothetical protein [unclassified Sphingobacterium]|uniref:hypothetical protein n=1 Tax=unclassified Sphingobacterium TaxID=2609468 RepID=UPI00104E4859|nr:MULTISPECIES: hypothetical protein [unclassified Sphingobacterium]MCS3557414.1 hypothetical protein [Sphingobacterium sp. JUb21]TCQ96301.1 hypothetical protein EDF66_1223 [Sphingobacterium sp. JUb20]